MAETIPYASPEPREPLKLPWRSAILMAAAVILIILSTMVGVCTESAWMCSICGSMRSETRWIGGLTTGKSTDLSPLDTWITRNQGMHTHDWRKIMGDGLNLFGGVTVRAHGAAPPVLFLGPQDEYLKSASTKEISEFVRIMQTGTDEEQRRAIEDAVEIINHQSLRRGGASTVPSS